MALANTVGSFRIGLTRFFASRWDAYPHIVFDTPFGGAGNWRHSWQWSILDFGTNEAGEERIRIIYPNAKFGNFAKTSTNALHMTFLGCTHERVLREGTNYYLMFLDGTRHHFTKWTNGTTKLFRMERTIDPYSNCYTYSYGSGLLSQVTGPNTNQYVHFSWTPVSNSVPAGDVEFYYTDNTATQVLLAGSFNGWNGQPMTLTSGQWTRMESLDRGWHFYKFVVRYAGDPDDYWKVDPDNPMWAYTGSVEDLQTNSVAVVDLYLISCVQASDGRSVQYSYGDCIPSIDAVDIPLTGASYGDGASGEYTYYAPSNDLYRKALLKSAHDPHYRGPGRAVLYVYQTNLHYTGEIYEERSLINNQLFARLVLDENVPEKRIVEDSHGNQMVIDFGGAASVTNPVGYVTRSINYDQTNDYMLWKWIDAKGQTSVYERTEHFGRATSVWNSVRGTRTFTYTDSTNPFFLARSVDYAFRTNTYERDQFNRVIRHTYPDGTFVTNSYNEYGQVVCHCGRDGATTSHQYDDQGRRTHTTDALGNSTWYGYGACDRLAWVSNALGYVTQYGYDWRGNPTNTMFADGTQETLWYDGYGSVTCRVDRSGAVTSYTYDDLGHLSSVQDAIGNVMSYTYDAEGHLLKTATSAGLTISNTYDGIGRKTRETYSSDNTYREWHYDPDGVRTQINRLGLATTYSYTPENWLRTVTDPEGRTTSYGFDRAGNPTHVTNANNDAMVYTFDQAGRVTSVTDCEGAVVSNAYDGAGRLTMTIDANGVTNEYNYDPVGRRVTVKRGGFILESNTYNAVGWIVRSVDAAGLVMSNTHDAAGRVLKRFVADGTCYEQQYTNTYLLRTIDRAGRTTTYFRDGLGRMTNQVDNATNSVRFAYDAAGNVTNLFDQNGTLTVFHYDVEGRQTAKTYADNSQMQYGYDAEGRLISKVDAIGRTTWYRYDAVGNLTNADYATDADVFFEYDALNRVTKMVDGVGTTIYTYAGSCGKVTSVDGPFAADTVAYGYDAGKRLTNLVYGDVSAAYDFDALDRITGVMAVASTNSYTYAASGRRLAEVVLGNGTKVAYQYDALARSTNLANRTSGEEVLSSFSYTYDDSDQRVAVVREDGRTVDYGYDPVGQLTSAQGSWPGYAFGYEYDPAENPLVQDRNGFVLSNAFNNLNQNVTSLWSGAVTVLGTANITDGVVTVNGTTVWLGAGVFAATNMAVVEGSNVYTAVLTDMFGRADTSRVSVCARDRGYEHDLNGNLTKDGERAYSWDEGDRLVEVRELVSGSTLMTCRYDGLGRRRERVTYAGGVGTTNRYVCDGWLVLAVLDATNGVVETYVHGPDLSGGLADAGGIGGLLCVRTLEAGTWTPRYYHYDGNGNVVGLTDTNETQVAAYEYAPFGQMLTSSGTYTSRYLFSSKEWDEPCGLYYYGYRYYSPQLGRWPSRDPIHNVMAQELRTPSARASICSYGVDLVDSAHRSSDSAHIEAEIMEIVFRHLRTGIGLQQGDFSGVFQRLQGSRQPRCCTYQFVNNSPLSYVDGHGLSIFPAPTIPLPWPPLDPDRPPCSGPPGGEAGKQDDKCTFPGGDSLNKCYQGCCADHDKCYRDNGCNFYSWIPGCGSSECNWCNVSVGLCFALTAIIDDPCCVE